MKNRKNILMLVMIVTINSSCLKNAEDEYKDMACVCTDSSSFMSFAAFQLDKEDQATFIEACSTANTIAVSSGDVCEVN